MFKKEESSSDDDSNHSHSLDNLSLSESSFDYNKVSGVENSDFNTNLRVTYSNITLEGNNGEGNCSLAHSGSDLTKFPSDQLVFEHPEFQNDSDNPGPYLNITNSTFRNNREDYSEPYLELPHLLEQIAPDYSERNDAVVREEEDSDEEIENESTEHSTNMEGF